jgi:AcrR family transcriptional regulator
MTKAQKTYHHGNLKQELIATAIKIVELEGVEAISLRKVGATIGVSQAALYRHFKNKTSLLMAVAVVAYEQLIGQQQDAYKSSDSHLKNVQTQGETYVHFARQHSNLFRLMFGQQFSHGENSPELQDCRDRSYALLQDPINGTMGDKSGVLDSHHAAVGARVMAHGLASLIIDGTLSPVKALDNDELDTLVSLLLSFYCKALDADN